MIGVWVVIPIIASITAVTDNIQPISKVIEQNIFDKKPKRDPFFWIGVGHTSLAVFGMLSV